MKIFVCIKQVPDTESKIKITADGSGIDPAGLKWVLNPYDEFAIEEAIKTRDLHAGSQIFVLSMGPKQRVVESLRTALAMGADEGLVINCTDAVDNLVTAQALAKVITQEGGADLIFTGKMSIDDNGSSVSQMIAENLKIPHATVVSKMSIDGDKILAERDIDGGAKEIVQLTHPAVIGANKGLNTPRYASLPGIMKAKKKAIKEIEFSSLSFAPTDVKTKFSRMTLPAEKPAVKLISGDTKSQATELVRLLRDEAKAL